MAYDINNDSAEDKNIDSSTTDKDKKVGATNKVNTIAKESILELVEAEDGTLQLRDANAKEEPLVTIAFSKKVADMLDGEIYAVGQHMIHSAIQMVMHKQVSSWHANVYDKEPEHYS